MAGSERRGSWGARLRSFMRGGTTGRGCVSCVWFCASPRGEWSGGQTARDRAWAARTLDGKPPKTEKIETRRMTIVVEGAALAALKRRSRQGGGLPESRRPELHARNAGDQGTMKGSMGHPDLSRHVEVTFADTNSHRAALWSCTSVTMGAQLCWNGRDCQRRPC